ASRTRQPSGAPSVPGERARVASPEVCSQTWRVRPLWSDTLSLDPRLRYPLETTASARWRSTLLLAANTKQPFSDTPEGDTVVLVDLRGRVRDIPSAARRGIRPIVGATGDTLYLLWGEPVPPVRMRNGRFWWPYEVRSVWFASRVGEGRWSAPRR